nr:MAG: replication associated protein [Cressdnaviricota sp.]
MDNKKLRTTNTWSRVAFKKRLGTAEQAIHYATKPHENCKCNNCEDERALPTKLSAPITFGVPAKQGIKRPVGKANLDLSDAVAALKAGKTVRDIALESSETFVKHFKGLQALADHTRPQRSWKTKVIVYWGVSGSGKSYKAFTENPGAYEIPHNTQGAFWFDGYDGQDVMLLNDYYGWLPHNFMLQLMDAYPMRLPIKGSYTQMAATKLIITSNTNPNTWYRKHWDKPQFHEHEKAFMRRLDEIVEFTEVWKKQDKQERDDDEHSEYSNQHKNEEKENPLENEEIEEKNRIWLKCGCEKGQCNCD